MQTNILISVRPHQTRIVHTKKNEIISYKVQNKLHSSLVGSVFMGRVSKILPGMGACFIDFGEKEEGFLHLKEVVSEKKQTEPIQKILNPNQLILVQVIKDPIRNKSCQLSMFISLTGSYLVYMPHLQGTGVSRLIVDEKERQRLEVLAKNLDLPGKVIVRTKAKGLSGFQKDADDLKNQWALIQRKKRNSPGLILKEISLAHRMLRDELNHSTDQIWIDEQKTFEKAKIFLEKNMVGFKNNIHFYNKPYPLFEKWGVEKKLKTALKKTLYLQSGGAIVIEENEAMVSVDVNTGRFVGKKDQEKTILKTNLEAVKEIALQMRIRNQGGIIVMDLIDMATESSKKKVLKQLEMELKKDRVHTNIVDFSSLNVLQMTRKRTGPSLQTILCKKCKACEGNGFLRTSQTIASRIFQEVEMAFTTPFSIRKKLLMSLKRKKETVQITTSPVVAQWITEYGDPCIHFLKKKGGVHIILKENIHFHPEQFEITPL